MFDPSSSKTTGYHLFAEPAGDLAKELRHQIATLAQEYGGPIFSPHITILSRVEGSVDELVTKTETLVASTPSFEVDLGELHAEDAYFRSLNIAIDTNIELMQLHERAKRLFSVEDTALYIPHISLLYGNYSQEEKNKTLETLKYLKGTSFILNSISLYKTEGEADQWEKIREFIIP